MHLIKTHCSLVIMPKPFRFKIGVSLCVLVMLGSSGCASFMASRSTPAAGVAGGDRTIPQRLQDRGIMRTASLNLYKLDPRFKLSRINIDSFHSVVLLTGQVPDLYLSQLAEQNVRAMPDVRGVQNFLTVGDKIDYKTIMQDSATTASIIRRLSVDRDVKPSRVHVVTEAGVVYLMGRLWPTELQAVLADVQQGQDVQKIVSLVDILGGGSREQILRSGMLEAQPAVYLPGANNASTP